ncbi:hypothetical protein VTI74DRAFT_3757 [Chaetomium olivicolor]
MLSQTLTAIPPAARRIAQSATLSTLNAWLTSQQIAFSILSSAQGVTLLAPSNNALNQLLSSPFAIQLAEDPNLLTAFLSYHVVNGVFSMADLIAAQPGASLPTFLNTQSYSNVTGGQKIESRSQNGAVTFISGSATQSNLEAFDLNYIGGTVHIIDSALSIPNTLTSTLLAGGFTAAVGAFRQVNVETNLNLATDVTIFVPTNDAFNAIASALSSLTVEQLTKVLNYHVVQGQVLYSQLLAGGGSVLTAEGRSLNIRAESGGLFVNSARVLQSDILISNGVVHIVDGVLNPTNTTATPNPSATTEAPAFDGATTTAGGVPFTSAVLTLTIATTNTPAAPPPTITISSPPPAVVPGSASDRTAAVGVFLAAVLGGVAVFANLA